MTRRLDIIDFLKGFSICTISIDAYSLSNFFSL